MAKFIKVKDEDGAETAINLDTVTRIVDAVDDEMTTIYFVDDHDGLQVEESMQDILGQAAKA